MKLEWVEGNPGEPIMARGSRDSYSVFRNTATKPIIRYCITVNGKLWLKSGSIVSFESITLAKTIAQDIENGEHP